MNSLIGKQTSRFNCGKWVALKNQCVANTLHQVQMECNEQAAFVPSPTRFAGEIMLYSPIFLLAV